jgi:hypothetical protein
VVECCVVTLRYIQLLDRTHGTDQGEITRYKCPLPQVSGLIGWKQNPQLWGRTGDCSFSAYDTVRRREFDCFLCHIPTYRSRVLRLRTRHTAMCYPAPSALTSAVGFRSCDAPSMVDRVVILTTKQNVTSVFAAFETRCVLSSSYKF